VESDPDRMPCIVVNVVESKKFRLKRFPQCC